MTCALQLVANSEKVGSNFLRTGTRLPNVIVSQKSVVGFVEFFLVSLSALTHLPNGILSQKFVLSL